MLRHPAGTLDAATFDRRSAARSGPLPTRVKGFYALVAAAAAGAAAPALVRLAPSREDWLTFGVLAAGAAAAQLFIKRTGRDHSFHTAVVFLIPAVLMLPPGLIGLMIVVQHVPEWFKQRYAWYIQSFNIYNYTLDALAAWGAAHFVSRWVPGSPDSRWAIAGFAACATFVVLNQALLGAMLYLARGRSLRQSGLLGVEALSTDLVLALLGLALVTFWRSNPWMIAAALAPLVLIQRSLAVPALKDQARVDPKTGLFNAGHFAAELEQALARAGRFERPLAIVMCDLDLLRDINNAHGHLAGDAVLRGVASIFRKQLRRDDLAARFGGEEFALLLPDTTAGQAVEIAEWIRREIADTTFLVETASEPIRATMSFGVAGLPQDGLDAESLVHNADLAVYQAKIEGRNRVCRASAERVALPSSAEPPGRRQPLRIAGGS